MHSHQLHDKVANIPISSEEEMYRVYQPQHSLYHNPERFLDRYGLYKQSGEVKAYEEFSPQYHQCVVVGDTSYELGHDGDDNFYYKQGEEKITLDFGGNPNYFLYLCDVELNNESFKPILEQQCNGDPTTQTAHVLLAFYNSPDEDSKHGKAIPLFDGGFACDLDNDKLVELCSEVQDPVISPCIWEIRREVRYSNITFHGPSGQARNVILHYKYKGADHYVALFKGLGNKLQCRTIPEADFTKYFQEKITLVNPQQDKSPDTQNTYNIEASRFLFSVMYHLQGARKATVTIHNKEYLMYSGSAASVLCTTWLITSALTKQSLPHIIAAGIISSVALVLTGTYCWMKYSGKSTFISPNKITETRSNENQHGYLI